MKYFLILGLAVFLVVGVSCDEKPSENAADTCEPGQDYVDGCNTCKCPENGKKMESACTLKACPEDSNIPTTPTDTEIKEKCQPGTTFQKDECNTCTCPEDGSKAGAACTAIACEPKQP